MHPRTRRLPDRHDVRVGEVLSEHSKARHLSQFGIRKRREIKAGCIFGEDLNTVKSVPVYCETTKRENGLTARFNPFRSWSRNTISDSGGLPIIRSSDERLSASSAMGLPPVKTPAPGLPGNAPTRAMNLV